MKQYKLDLGLEPSIWERLGFDDIESTIDWFIGEEYENWREKIRQEQYDAWSRCWKSVMAILESRETHSKATIELAESVFQVMCNSSMVPIVEGQFCGAIARNQLD